MRKANAAPRHSTELGIRLKNPAGYEFAVSAVDAAGTEGEKSAPVSANAAQ
jgi:hypothetical protein